MAIINDVFRQKMHKEMDWVMDRLEEQEKELAGHDSFLSDDQIYHAFSGLSNHAVLISTTMKEGSK